MDNLFMKQQVRLLVLKEDILLCALIIAVLNRNAPSFSSNMTQLRAELMIEVNRR
jgi:hypothetical protein